MAQEVVNTVKPRPDWVMALDELEIALMTPDKLNEAVEAAAYLRTQLPEVHPWLFAVQVDNKLRQLRAYCLHHKHKLNDFGTRICACCGTGMTGLKPAV
jgi:hypothetical protein